MLKSFIFSCLRSVFLFFLPLKIFCSSYLDYLSAYFKDPEALVITDLKGGLTDAKNYRIKEENKEYVLRILNPADNLEARQTEITAAIFAGKTGIGPRVYYAAPSNEAILMDFVPGAPLSCVDQPNQLLPFLQTVRKLHESEGTYPQGKTAFGQIRMHLYDLKHSTIPTLHREIDEALEMLHTIEQKFKNQPLVPCHHDLNALNVIVNGSIIKLIDWTNAGMGYAYTDLGYFALLNCIDEKQHFKLLSLYLGKAPSHSELELLKLGKQVGLLSIFASVFVAHEVPITEDEQRTKRQIELKKAFQSEQPLSLTQFIKMHKEGKINTREIAIAASLCALKTFLHQEGIKHGTASKTKYTAAP